MHVMQHALLFPRVKAQGDLEYGGARPAKSHALGVILTHSLDISRSHANAAQVHLNSHASSSVGARRRSYKGDRCIWTYVMTILTCILSLAMLNQLECTLHTRWEWPGDEAIVYILKFVEL